MKTHLDDLLQRFQHTRVLVIGDLMLDHYIWGDVTRISPEAPVPVVRVVRETQTAGGAANVALNLSALGVNASLLGIIGEDSPGEGLLDLLRQQEVDVSPIIQRSDTPTIVKTRVLARTQQLCRIDRESGKHSYAIPASLLRSEPLSTLLSESDAIILSDYAKGALTQPLVDEVRSLANQRGIMVAVDHKPSSNLDLRGLGLMTPNRHEALEMAKLPEPCLGDPYPLEETCRRIHAKDAPALLVITLGADGLAICREGRVEKIMPTQAKEVFDVSGAGDTVIATLTAALAAGLATEEAAHIANVAAGIVVGKIGTATASRAELKAAIHSTPQG
jgi:D-beta-D-heptose 7-phosphate kinase/D-beta-D-heptose 1-phosphate adenosyltransferase